MELKWEANISLNGRWWATAVVSKDYVGEEEAKLKCRLLEDGLNGGKNLGFKVTLTKWEGVGHRFEIR